ncbi:energy-coupling factor transporter transmembrane component T family protein [Rathayibacter soli]|uniref:energy-coupling factor transporter transmembrane component T family protein n=1 Tax=Rathayibacter soli TaxID=3144168 RepID=UPI0027E4D8B4|nr:energy-coupling factor transporter transmembrane component T [Glaciibacter superstes]
MTVISPLRIGRLAQVNPVAKLAAVLVISVTLILTIDWVSAAVALALECLLLAWARLPLRSVFIRTLPLLIAAPLAGLTTVLYGQPGGQTYWQWWAVQVSDGSIALGIATTLRILAVGIPAIVLFITIDPTDLADGLAQIVHLPARFVLGALAALRLAGLFIEDWRALELARRARGIADRGRLRRLVSVAFALLVLSIRRGSKLATAMEARAFDAPVARTWARPSVFAGRDWIVIGLGGVVAASAVLVSIAAGSWNFVLG